ncbi:hypothetical protein BBO99_00002635 [Phytophthora kernoviae]|uniref:HSF-type DNA-binding domain-containing protein n=2 Tax=Phytophthora kernoviae TaxID=325452 RepID=A0A3R7HZJ3_9STRA|nr:hypothetical protein G195_009438 [Phytophthora kernoviae 00238/432]KAG2526945.1 hypothetical protein JM16_002779 [Phytophthora kernoviae]KAG2528427.1 hypothetical protein JM18_002609 [Phytophthora kernoviae]RLN14129.1 hypothetical protein BBI17_002579 [Phytophthora kernoviae]RLN82793.1 hypothetical protein BBO99_00002635 [Phytophthora kernoviae]
MKDVTSLSGPVPLTPACSRRPRAQSMQHFSDKCSIPRECCSSGSFVSKLYRMVDSEPSSIVSWCRGGTAFCIVDSKMMAEHCLPKYFRHRRFSSLIRQLNFYSFYRVQEGQLTIYQHSFFRKGRPDLLVHIKRRGAGKAKDPWFDPLATASKPSDHTPVNISSLSGIQTPTLAPVSGRTCYSPMAKPIALDNMSPALKPAMIQASPPSVDLGGSMLSEGLIKKDMDHLYPLSSALSLKNECIYGDLLDTTSLIPSKSSGLSTPLDIDIQDFLTDDCSITPGQMDDRLSGGNNSSSSMNPKCAMVSRDCLKFDEETHSSLEPSPVLTSQETSDSASFENEVLMDLANVEPGAWEVPLSPLNDEEDMMPWLDLCF